MQYNQRKGENKISSYLVNEITIFCESSIKLLKKKFNSFFYLLLENTNKSILFLRETETGKLKLPQNILSRHSSVSNLMVKKFEESPSTSSDVDAFDHILKMSSQHEAIMAFYYMDVNKQVC